MMTNDELERLKFPVGTYIVPEVITPETRVKWIDTITRFPDRLKSIVGQLSNEQKNWKYRPGGWTVKQVIHHCADSHINAFIRFKLSLTENEPTIKPYLEHLWAELTDGNDDNLDYSLLILEGLHYKWSQLLRELKTEALNRCFIHPEHGQKFSLDETIGNYAWHCNHHFAHIEQALESEGKYNN